VAFSIAHKDGRQILTLEGGVTIQHAQELASRLAHALEDGAAVAVDAELLEDVDTCILQLLCSLSKTVPALSFDSPSQAFLGAVDRCGLRRELPGLREIA
jgi:anti-anti-sigma regulatory factor